LGRIANGIVAVFKNGPDKELSNFADGIGRDMLAGSIQMEWDEALFRV